MQIAPPVVNHRIVAASSTATTTSV